MPLYLVANRLIYSATELKEDELAQLEKTARDLITSKAQQQQDAETDRARAAITDLAARLTAGKIIRRKEKNPWQK